MARANLLPRVWESSLARAGGLTARSPGGVGDGLAEPEKGEQVRDGLKVDEAEGWLVCGMSGCSVGWGRFGAFWSCDQLTD